MRSLSRRLGAVAVTAAVAVGSTAVAPAQAANVYGENSADWLAGQLTNGLAVNDQFDFTDYGLSLDIAIALQAAGRPAAAASVLNAIDDDPGVYIGSGADIYAGSTAKLATVAQLQGRSATGFGGVNLITRLQGRITATGAETGRATDTGTDFSNTVTQSWAVRALSTAKSGLADEAVGFLVKQQCAAGFFREGPEATGTSSTFTCDDATAAAPSVDATAFAVQALATAKASGATGLDDDLADASTWLAGQQSADGAFVGNATKNTNTTGLAAAALALTGRTAAAEKAAAWIARQQVSEAIATVSRKLREQVGAIAYDAAALATARAEGIPVEMVDQFRRATSQATIGVLMVDQLTGTAPTRYLAGGSTVTVRFAGLAAGEAFTVRNGARVVAKGTASASGAAAPRVTLPRATGRYTLLGTGSTSARADEVAVRVLGARTFGLRLADRTVKRNRTQQVTVRGLAAGETVRISYRGKRIFTGTASATGRVVDRFKVGASVGSKRLTVRGEFANRTASTTFRVIR